MKTPLPPIVFEDDAFIAFDKPGGLLVAPDRWDKERENLMQMVHEQLSRDYFNAHRLDKDASGVLLCAKTKDVLRSVCRLFESGAVAKQYVALVHGTLKEERGCIRLALRTDPNRPGRMRVAGPGGGKPSETKFEVAEHWRRYSMVQLEPLTGRTHQLRVHLAAEGNPIVGDSLYGGRVLKLSELKPGYKFKSELRPGHKFKVDVPEKPLMGRLALHSWKLSFRHPRTNEMVAIEAPLPKDFQISIKYLRRWVPLEAAKTS